VVNVPLFIPKDPKGDSLKILPGSAVVGGQLLDNGRRMVYFEGNKYNAQDGKRFVVRCLLAYGRMAQRYPTVAKAAMASDDLVQVGEFDPVRSAVSVHKSAELATWLGMESLPLGETIYRNPLIVRDIEHFRQLADTELPGEFYIALGAIAQGTGVVSEKAVRWVDDRFWIRNNTDDIEQQLTPDVVESTAIGNAIRQHAFFFVIPNVPRGTGWY
jgi:hypothetical protein